MMASSPKLPPSAPPRSPGRRDADALVRVSVGAASRAGRPEREGERGSKRSSRLPQRVMRWALSLAMVSGAAGCGGNRNGEMPGAKSPETQSDAEYDVARDLFYKGQTRAALDHVLKAVELNEDNARAHYFAAIVYLSFCNTDRGLGAPDCRLADAESYARRAVKADPRFRDAQNLLGNVLALRGRYAEAIDVLEPLTRDAAYTEMHLAWGNLGWAQVQGGRLDEGIQSLKNAVTQPRFCVGHYRLGVAYERKGDLSAAEQSFSDALAVDSPECRNLQDAWEGRGRVRAKMGRLAEARDDLARCRDISEGSETGRACARALGASLGAKAAAPPPKQ